MSTLARTWGRGAALLAACLAMSLAWGQQRMEVLELQHRSAEEVIPLLEPLLAPGAALTGEQHTLFVRTDPANLRELRRVLAAIDRAPRQLQVSVRQSTRADMERAGLVGSGTISTGDGSVVVNEPPRRGSGVSVRAAASSDRQRSEGVATLRVLEGHAAYIARGTSVPVVTAFAADGVHRPRVAGVVEYRELASGWQVTPRIAGERVTLEIEQQSEHRGQGSDIQTQQLVTRVSGPLGEWLELGGVQEAAGVRQGGIAARTYRTRSDELALWVKVEVVAP